MNSSTPEAYPGATLDQSIDIAAMHLGVAKDPDERRSAWNLLRTLCNERSRNKERVRQMEVEQGIAR